MTSEMAVSLEMGFRFVVYAVADVSMAGQSGHKFDAPFAERLLLWVISRASFRRREKFHLLCIKFYTNSGRLWVETS